MENYKNYKLLAMAVVKQAVRDYQVALRTLHFNPNDTKAKSTVKRIEGFVHSERYQVMCDIDGDTLLAKAEDQLKANDYHVKENRMKTISMV